MSGTRSWCFGPFRLDPATGSLWRDEVLLPLPPKPFTVLAYLVAHAGQVVSKETLLEAVWPHTAVTEGVLKTCWGRSAGRWGTRRRPPGTLPRYSGGAIALSRPSWSTLRPSQALLGRRRWRRRTRPTSTRWCRAPLPCRHPRPNVATSPCCSATWSAQRRSPDVWTRKITARWCAPTTSSVPRCCSALTAMWRNTSATACWAILAIRWRMKTTPSERSGRGWACWTPSPRFTTHPALPPGEPVAVRLGVHTGLVVMGDVGAGARHEPLALGETPNIAARLQHLAAPNTLVISAATQQLVAGYFRCKALGAHTLPGLAQPMEVYRVLGASGAQSRLEVAATHGLTPLVGRAQEVGLLMACWTRVTEGMGQVVLLGGEAGIGKSRLVQVLKEHVAGEGHPWLECQGSPYYQHTALYPLTELLARRLLPVEHEATAAQKVQHLEAFLRQHGLSPAETVPLLAPLLSLPLPATYAPVQVSPEQQRQQTLHALLGLLLRLAADAAAPPGHGRPALGRSLHAGVAQSPGGSRPDRPHSGPVHLSAGLPSAVDGALASHPGDAGPLAPAPGHRTDAPGRAGQGAASGGGRADRGQDRWGAAVRGGVNQDGAGIRPAPGAGGALCAHRAPAAAGDSRHAARLAAGAAGPPGGGQGPGTTRGDAGARVCLCTCSRPWPRGTRRRYDGSCSSWWRRSCCTSGGCHRRRRTSSSMP